MNIGIKFCSALSSLTAVFPRQTNPEPAEDELLAKSTFAPLIPRLVQAESNNNNNNSLSTSELLPNKLQVRNSCN